MTLFCLLVFAAHVLALAVVRPNVNVILAVENNNVEALKQLLSKETPVLVAEAMDAAVSSGEHFEVFKMLLPLAVDVSSVDYFDILVKVMDSGKDNLVDFILPPSSSPLTSSQRKAILDLASRNCRVDIAQKFVENFEEYKNPIEDVLILSIRNRKQVFCDDELQDEIILLLYNVASDQMRSDALWYAASYEHVHLVSKFLEYPALTGADISKALLAAVRDGDRSLRLFRVLLSDPRITADRRREALMTASSTCNSGALGILLSYNDYTMKSNDNAFRSAASNISPRSNSCVSMLIHRPGVLPESIESALKNSVLADSLDRAQLLLDSGQVTELQRIEAFTYAIGYQLYAAAVPLQGVVDIETLYAHHSTLLQLCVENNIWDGVVELIRLGHSLQIRFAFLLPHTLEMLGGLMSW